MELRNRPIAQHRRRRALHPAGVHRRYERRLGARARQVQGVAHHAPAGRRGDPGICAASAGFPDRASLTSMAPLDDADVSAHGAPAPAASVEAPSAQPSVDADNPWLGLASFTEQTRAFFYGREEEI